MDVKSILDGYFRVYADDDLVVQRGQRLIILILLVSVADLLTLFNDIVSGIVTPPVLAVELLALVIFAVLYRYTRHGHRWPPYLFLAFMALSTPYVVQDNLTSPMVLAVAVPVVVAPLVAAPRLSILLSAVEVIILYVFGLASYPLYPVVAIILGLLGVISWLSSSSLENAFKEARRNASALAGSNRELEAGRDTLQIQTDELGRRARYLEATARVARDAASVLELQELLSRVVGLIAERFGFYHVGIFLLDPTGEWAVLQAASSEGGQGMMAGGYRQRVGEEGIVGYVTGRGEPRIALDVGVDAAFFDSPDLPETRSEMALPLRARGEIIGALDVQSGEPEAFSEEDVAVLQTLADQVAVAISNARLFRQVEESLEAERRAYGEASHQAWRELLQAYRSLGYRYRQGNVAPLTEQPGAPQLEAHDRQASEINAQIAEELPELVLPVRVRGHMIGTIKAHKPGDDGGWGAEEVTLMEALAEQLGLALESARLYHDSQQRALRERLTGEIAARMRETLDMDMVLQGAIREIGERLGIAEVEVRVGGEVVLAGPQT